MFTRSSAHGNAAPVQTVIHSVGVAAEVGGEGVEVCVASDMIIANNVGTKNSPIVRAPSTTKTPSNTTMAKRARRAASRRSSSGTATSSTGNRDDDQDARALVRQQRNPVARFQSGRIDGARLAERYERGTEPGEECGRHGDEVPPPRGHIAALISVFVVHEYVPHVAYHTFV